MGGVRPVHTHRIQCAHYRLLVAVRLDPDGNEISTDEEETIERARAMTRRNNPQPLFNLFRPIIRGSNDGPTSSRGDDVGVSEAQLPAQSGHTSTTQSPDAAEDTPEVVRFPRIHRGADIDMCCVTTQGSHETKPNHACAVNYINPLPMPLHEMIRPPNRKTDRSRQNTKRKSSRRTIGVSPSAQLAGR